jgi:hypothetical protein
MASTIDKQIRAALKTKLETLPWVKKVESQVIQNTDDLREHEVPFIQVYTMDREYEPQMTEVLTKAQVFVELVLRTNVNGQVDLDVLDDRRQEVIELIGSDPTLGIKIIQMLVKRDKSDLGTVPPFFMTVIEFEALYRKPYVREC